MTCYYNDSDPYPAAWLRRLITHGRLPPGAVDERPIQEVAELPPGLDRRAHFFAGVGGWPLALTLAGWPATAPVWTGSCPCQPFSKAGRARGHRDARHLWPEWFRLIRKHLPPVIFGEQVASRLGREWLAGVRADLEAVGYAVGAADLCAAGLGTPHIRQRIFFGAVRVGHSDLPRLEGHHVGGDGPNLRAAWTPSVAIPCGDGKTRRIKPGIEPLADGVPARVGRIRAYGNAIVPQVAATFVRAFMEALWFREDVEAGRRKGAPA